MQSDLSRVQNWEENIKAMNALVVNRGAKFISILQPNLASSKNVIDRGVRKKDHDLRVLPLYKDFTNKAIVITERHPFAYSFVDALDGKDRPVFTDSCHLTEYGNKIIAQKIFDLIQHE